MSSNIYEEQKAIHTQLIEAVDRAGKTVSKRRICSANSIVGIAVRQISTRSILGSREFAALGHVWIRFYSDKAFKSLTHTVIVRMDSRICAENYSRADVVEGTATIVDLKSGPTAPYWVVLGLKSTLWSVKPLDSGVEQETIHESANYIRRTVSIARRKRWDSVVGKAD